MRLVVLKIRMSAFINTGRSNTPENAEMTVRFRPQAMGWTPPQPYGIAMCQTELCIR